MFIGIPSDAEQVRQFTYTEASDVLTSRLIESFANQSSLLLLQLDDSVLHRSCDKDAVDFYRSVLADTMCPIDGLLFDERICKENKR